MMNDDHAAVADGVIPFPGPAPDKSLAAVFDEFRRVAYRTGLPILGGKTTRLNQRLNEADQDELTEAADGIVASHMARMAIRAAARYEECWNRRVARDEWFSPGMVRMDAAVDEIRMERDQAVAAYLSVRERQAKLEHLEAINRRAKPGGARVGGNAARGTGVA